MTEPLRSLIIILGTLIGSLSVAAGLIWLERRLLALWQDRYGPNRVGPFGLLQVLADVIKIFSKEDWVPPFADKPVFVLAPAIIIATVLMIMAGARTKTGLSANGGTQSSLLKILITSANTCSRPNGPTRFGP